MTFEIRAEVSDSAAPLDSTVGYNITARAMSAAKVRWDVEAWNVFGQLKSSPDLTPLLQEVASRPGWRAGNDLLLIYTVVAGTGTRKCFAHDYYHSGAAAPSLSLTVAPPSSAKVLGPAFNMKTCDLTVEVAHPTAYEGSGHCSTLKELAAGRPAWASTPGGGTCSSVHVRASSGGEKDGNFASIAVNGKSVLKSSRGINVAVVDRETRQVKRAEVFDTSYVPQASERFAQLVNEAFPGDIVAIAVMSDAAGQLMPVAQEALLALGASSGSLQAKESFALVTRKRSNTADSGTALDQFRDTMVRERRASSQQSPGRGGVSASLLLGCGGGSPKGRPSKEPDWQWMLKAQEAGGAGQLVAPAELAVDGDKASYWLSADSDDAVWQLELGGLKALHQVALSFAYAPARFGLLTSSDGLEWRTVHSSDAGREGGTVTVMLQGEDVTARHLRVYMAGALHHEYTLADCGTVFCDTREEHSLGSPCSRCGWHAGASRRLGESDSSWLSRLYAVLACRENATIGHALVNDVHGILQGLNVSFSSELQGLSLLTAPVADSVCNHICSDLRGAYGLAAGTPLCRCGQTWGHGVQPPARELSIVRVWGGEDNTKNWELAKIIDGDEASRGGVRSVLKVDLGDTYTISKTELVLQAWHEGSMRAARGQHEGSMRAA